MPYINTTTTKQITENDEAALRKAFGSAISIIPGKSEEWLMLRFEGNAKMSFGGSTDDSAMVEIESYGVSETKYYEALAREVVKILNLKLGIPANRIYVKYREVDIWFGAFNL